MQSTTDRIQKLGLQNQARVIHGDFLQVDLSPADVVTMYLATDTNEMLRPNLEKQLKNGRARRLARLCRPGLEG